MEEPINVEELKKEDWFEIIAKNPDSASPSFSFRWCIHKMAREKLIENKVAFPFLMVTIWERPKNQRLKIVTREIYPLDQGMSFIDFSRPGKFELTGSIIWVHSHVKRRNINNARKAVGALMNYDSGYSYLKLHDGESYCPEFLEGPFKCLDFHVFMEIKIDENLFGKEPPEWSKKWINLFYKNKAKNECELKKRKYCLIFKLPFAFLIYAPFIILLRLILATVAILAGTRLRAISWRYIFQPFDAISGMVISFDDFFDEDKTWWLTKNSGADRHPLESIILCPFIHLVFIVTLGFTTRYQYPTIAYSNILWFTVCFFGFAWLIFYISHLLGITGKKRSKEESILLSQKYGKMLDEMLEKQVHTYYKERISPLSDSKEVSVKSLPKSHQTYWLRYRSFLATVCKPMRQ